MGRAVPCTQQVLLCVTQLPALAATTSSGKLVFLSVDGLVRLDCICDMLCVETSPAWGVDSLAPSSSSQCRCTRKGGQKVRFKGLQQLGSTVPAYSVSDCCHHYFNELCMHPFHSHPTQNIQVRHGNTYVILFILFELKRTRGWGWGVGWEKEESVISCSRNILDIHRLNERKELNVPTL